MNVFLLRYGWIAALFANHQLLAQSTDLTADTLTAKPLNEVVVRAYESNRSLLNTAASVGLLSRRDLTQRFATPTLVSAMNTLPGVRMDERSPGSYRLSIRGSLIRSPFGVRNVRVYYQDMPLTDAAGNTPLNALDVRILGRVEVIKGPSGSLYGSNTGGTVLLGGPATVAGTNQVEVGYLAGSYGQQGYNALAQSAGESANITVSVNHLQADGYRDHSRSVRDNLALTGTVALTEKQSLTGLFIYSDLYYETPGGLTEAQYRANPAASRPATRTLPGSAEQGAAINQKVAYLGVSHRYIWNPRWQTTNVLYTSSTEFNNPFITNYERRTDQGLGGRSITRFSPTGGAYTLTMGGEWQTNRTIDRNFGNRKGQIDTLQTDDELRAQQWNVFLQNEIQLPLGLVGTLGLSYNQTQYQFTRFSIAGKPGPGQQNRAFTPVGLLRVAVSKSLGQQAALFFNVSSGYSAPTSQEVLSSAGFFNADLEPERGIQAELGLRGRLFNRLQFDVVGYSLQLSNTIVRRSLANGAEYFVNAGRTQQLGLESYLGYDLLPARVTTSGPVLKVWQSLTLTDYTYLNYQQLAVDLSGKKVPGVAPLTGVWGLDALLPMGLYAHVTYQFLTPFVLNDANTATADPTRLLQATVGYKQLIGKHITADLYAGGDNLLDQTYSLGYDLNAVGNRYYNAAPRRNFTVGLRLGIR
ncbi:TonB-dependent receptor plug domain-containing protein [Fibrella sp. HMF5335]|uniref:TonB-dependent receptor plug domain-containing protein n=1 Tax=Fibrella rubiginis TaxID=2817060 RepID=A0A939GCN1_9BACT|nr:TonB-dependent receptor plug domain-containing protein [Fibrella rubiginis]MBO0935896.1 TonB-dependent receptor plug domain-containing protein [Fibrella rubiginis]